MLEQNECDASNMTTNATSHNDHKLTFNHLPNNIHFHTVAVDSQHLWIDPHVSNFGTSNSCQNTLYHDEVFRPTRCSNSLHELRFTFSCFEQRT